MHLGSLNGHVEVVETLINAGAEVEAKDEDNDTALILAVYEGHLPVVKALLANNANVNHHRELG